MAEKIDVQARWARLTADAARDEKLAERLRTQPVSVLEEYGLPLPQGVELTDEDLEQVTGGMKYTPGTRNADVIDARGGQFEVLGVTFTLNRAGTISSVNGKSTGA